MPYSTMQFIESLKPVKEGLVTRLFDSVSGAQYGWIFELGPLTILKITGWHGERIRGYQVI